MVPGEYTTIPALRKRLGEYYRSPNINNCYTRWDAFKAKVKEKLHAMGAKGKKVHLKSSSKMLHRIRGGNPVGSLGWPKDFSISVSVTSTPF